MKVSIVIPVYNKSRVLRDCIHSVLSQSFTDFEVLLIDDGSSDSSYDIMLNAAKEDSRIKVIHQENKGPGAARNKGISLAQGEYLLFIDADDTIENYMLEKMINSCNENTDVVICGYDEYDSNGKVINKVNEKQANLDLRGYLDIIAKWKDSPLVGAPWNKLYRINVIKTYNLKFPDDQTWGEDLMFNISVIEKAKCISIISDCLYKYKRAEGSLSKTNHIKYGNNLEEFWFLKHRAYSKIRSLFLNYSASTSQLIQLKELELTYIYSIIHLRCRRKGFGNFVNLTRRILDGNDLEATEMVDYRRLFPKVTYIRAWLLINCNIYILCIFEKMFYSLVRVIRSIQMMAR